MTDEEFQELQRDWCNAVYAHQLESVGNRLMDELIKARNELHAVADSLEAKRDGGHALYMAKRAAAAVGRL